MAKQFAALDDTLSAFIKAQPLFFVGSAAREGKVNVSPKGMDSLRLLSPTRVAWLNLTGSGNETAGHLRDSNRMTLMFCSFDRQPLILRLYGSARTLHPRDAEWSGYLALFPEIPGARQIFLMDIELVQTSCGFAVPFMQYQGEREALRNLAEKRGPEGLKASWIEQNRVTLDGLDTGILPLAPAAGQAPA